jgi:hypothetical protein
MFAHMSIPPPLIARDFFSSADQRQDRKIPSFDEGTHLFECMGKPCRIRKRDVQLERFVSDLCRVMTIQDVAELTGLNRDTVKDIDKGYLKDKYQSV